MLPSPRLISPYLTKTVRGTCLIGLLLAGALLPQAQAVLITTGVYDENLTDEVAGGAIQNNTVDVSATTTGTGQQISVSTFTTAVLSAYNNNLGGVINFDNGTIDDVNDYFNATYGVSQSRTLRVDNAVVGQVWNQFTSANRTGISHATDGTTGQMLGITGNLPDGTGPDFTFNFSPADQVVMVGGTLMSRSGSAVTTISVTATAFFSDLTSSSVTFNSSGINNGGNDTFAGFAAPTGLYITRFQFDLPQNEFRALDDLGFIVIPEPSSGLILLGSLGALAMLRRRR